MSSVGSDVTTMSDYMEFKDPYDTDGLYEVEELRGRLGNLLLMTAIIIAGLLLLAMIWKACFSENDEVIPKQTQGLPQAVFAHDVEPGFVVLQTQDGQFFRVLHEYSEAKWHKVGSNGSRSRRDNSYRSDSSSSWRPITEVESVVYTPQYTSAHYQTQPTAPLPQQVGLVPTRLNTTDMSNESLLDFDPSNPPPYEPRDH